MFLLGWGSRKRKVCPGEAISAFLNLVAERHAFLWPCDSCASQVSCTFSCGVVSRIIVCVMLRCESGALCPHTLQAVCRSCLCVVFAARAVNPNFMHSKPRDVWAV